MRKFLFLAIFVAILGSFLGADELDEYLLTKAKRYNLQSIPNEKDKLNDILKTRYKNDKYPITEQIINLGNKLYHDPRLSGDGTVSCASCHDLNNYGTDSLSTAVGVGNKQNPQKLNSPTVFNSALNLVQFWDGRAMDLETQAAGPLTNDFEMDNTKEQIEKTINSIPGYVEEFKAAFGVDKVTFELVAVAISHFERTLIVRSRYDNYLEGNLDALSMAEKEGFKVFLDGGCAVCHNNMNLGGEMRQFEIFGKYEYKDIGGFMGNKTGLVKAPSLRFSTKTAPYFHNGMISTLKDAIKTMTEIQTGIPMSNEDINKLITFLEAISPSTPKFDYPELP